MNSNPPIVRLAAPFAGFGRHAGTGVGDDDSRLHFVAVLTARTRSADRLEMAIGQQPFDRERRGMDRMIRVHNSPSA